MSTALSKVRKILEDDGISSTKRAAKRANEFEGELYVFACSCQATQSIWNEMLFRRRWDEAYLRDLATREKSLITEYRLDPPSFDVLSDMLEVDLQVNQKMSEVSTKSGPISTKSYLCTKL